MPIFFDANANPVILSRKLGEGGEGAVFDIEEKTEFAAKIYHEKIHQQKEEKLRAMVLSKNDSLQNIAAWPVETLHTKTGKLSGFMMPKIFGYKPIHELYSPKSRRQEFPFADWRFLLHVAANAARAVSVIHQNGHVIGDLNHGNLVVSANGTVKLIDCDSFQVQLQDKTYLCEVGVAEYTAPELHGRNFTATPRNPNHDAFGLGILLFHLLFMGRHPFAGKFLGFGDMPIYKAIRENRFAYSALAQKFQMQPPPFTLPASTLPAALFQLFEKAFLAGSVYGNDRPKATDWVDELTRFSNNIKTCSLNLSHHFYAALATCPWCKQEKSLGADLFVVNTSQQQISGFNINTLWQATEAIKSPGKAPQLPVPKATPSAIAQKVRKQKIIFKTAAVALAIIAFIGGLMLFNTGLFFVAWLLGALAAWHTWNQQPIKNKIQLNFSVAEGRYNAVINEWQAEAGDRKFISRLKELVQTKNEYHDLQDLRKREMERLKQQLKETQLLHFLEKFRITDHKFDNIGVERKSMLLSYGIENASDISKKKVKIVPGFGKVLTEKLLEWRKELESKFVFNPYLGIDPRDVAELDRKISNMKKQLETELSYGATELNKIRQDILLSREKIKPRLLQIMKEFAQAEADLNYINTFA